MKFEDLQKILNLSKERNQDIESRKQTKKIFDELKIPMLN